MEKFDTKRVKYNNTTNCFGTGNGSLLQKETYAQEYQGHQKEASYEATDEGPGPSTRGLEAGSRGETAESADRSRFTGVWSALLPSLCVSQ